MSIWSSVQSPNVRPVPRDNYTGEPVPDGAEIFVDVATTSFHDCVRFVIDGDGERAHLILTAVDVAGLIRLLSQAWVEVAS